MIQSLFILLLFSVFIACATDGFAIENTPLESLRDIKGPVYFPSNNLLLIMLVLLFLAVAIFALIQFLKRKKKKVEEEPIDPRMPWEIANDQFDELEKGSLLNEGQFKAYYSQLSGIIRQYFENRFKIRAPEMTTEEFLWSLEKSGHLTVNQNDTLKQFLNSCDIVKFAKYVPRIEEGKASIQLARKLVEETKIIASETSPA